MIRINLLQPGKKEIAFAPAGLPVPEEEGKKIYYEILAIVTVITLGVIGFMYYRANSRISFLNEQIRIKEQEKRRLQGVLKELEENKKKKEILTQKTQVIEQLIAKQIVPVKLMDLIVKEIPDKVWLTKLKFNGSQVLLEGKALNNNLIATFIANLEATDFFKNVELISSKKVKARQKSGIEVYSFKLAALVNTGGSEAKPQGGVR